MQRNEFLSTAHSTLKKVKSKWIVDLNVKPKTTKFLEEKQKNICVILGKATFLINNIDRMIYKRKKF